MDDLPEVERFDPPTVGKRAWPESMEPSASGVYVYYSDYEKARQHGAEEARRADAPDVLKAIDEARSKGAEEERERLREMLEARAEKERAKKTMKGAGRAIALEEARTDLDG